MFPPLAVSDFSNSGLLEQSTEKTPKVFKQRSSIRRWVWLPAGSHVDQFKPLPLLQLCLLPPLSPSSPDFTSFSWLMTFGHSSNADASGCGAH